MWPRICATGELKLEEITAASWHRVGDHNTAIRQPYLLPLRLPETTVRIGDDAGCEGLGNSFAEMRQTFPKRWLARSTGVRSASVRAVAASSSINSIFSPSTPSIYSSAIGHIFLCLRPGSPPSLPSNFPAYPVGSPPSRSISKRESSSSSACARHVSTNVR
jgi:hypothetical protein